ALWRAGDHLGVALADVTTADFWVGESSDLEGLTEALVLRRPAEVLLPPGIPPDDPIATRLRATGAALTGRDAAAFGLREAEDRLRAQFRVTAVEGLGLPARGGAVRAAGAVLGYLRETQQTLPAHLTRIQTLALEDHLTLDESAARNLELVESLQDRGQAGTLLTAMDRTRTSMGGRLLRQWLLRPLCQPREIGERLAAVPALVETPTLLADLRQGLDGIGDLARLASRVALGVAGPRDLAALRATLGLLPTLRAHAERCADPQVRQCAE